MCIFDVGYVMSSEVITLLLFNKDFKVVLSLWMERFKKKKKAEFLFAPFQLLCWKQLRLKFLV